MNAKSLSVPASLLSILLAACALTALPSQAAAPQATAPQPGAPPAPAAAIPAADLIQPAELAAQLRQAAPGKPVILHVGFRVLYEQAHIPGSQYVGAASEPAGLQALRERVATLPKDAPIVIYCGCCPWNRCPNVKAANNALRALGHTRVRVLYIADDFGTNWVDQGYPSTSGT